jgi:hypothetical protein
VGVFYDQILRHYFRRRLDASVCASHLPRIVDVMMTSFKTDTPAVWGPADKALAVCFHLHRRRLGIRLCFLSNMTGAISFTSRKAGDLASVARPMGLPFGPKYI